MRTLLFAILAAGCGTRLSSIPLNPAPHPTTPRPGAAVELYSSGPPARAHVDVAVLTADPMTDGADAMLAALRAQAGAMGCDALVIDGVKHRAQTIEGMTATCIVYLDAVGARAPATRAAGDDTTR